jgi:hypothetical protein
MRYRTLSWAGMAIVGVAIVMLVPVGIASAGGGGCHTGTCVTTPPFDSSIAARFGGQSIASGDVIWFTSVLQLGGSPHGGGSPGMNLTVIFTGQTLTFTEPGGTTFVEHLPKGEVVFSTTAKNASTVYNTTSKAWVTTVPANYNGDIFLSGYSYYVGSAGLPRGTQVNWSGRFVSPDCMFQLTWKWTAMVYSQFAGTQSKPNYPGIDVVPTDGKQWGNWGSYQHGNGVAGTPSNFQKYYVGDALGGGYGSNCQQQIVYTQTACVQKPHCF